MDAVPHDSDMPEPPWPKLWMIVLVSSLPAFRTNPDGRWGRRPMVVRITRSHAAFTVGNRTGGRLGAGCGFAAERGAQA